jgi:hypothetical protein
MSEDIERPLGQRNFFKQQWGGGRPKIAKPVAPAITKSDRRPLRINTI